MHPSPPSLPPNKEKANYFSNNLAAPRYHIIIIENKKIVNVIVTYRYILENSFVPYKINLGHLVAPCNCVSSTWQSSVSASQKWFFMFVHVFSASARRFQLFRFPVFLKDGISYLDLLLFQIWYSSHFWYICIIIDWFVDYVYW